MKYFYTNSYGHTIELDVTEEYEEEMHFIEKAEVAIIAPEYVVDCILNEISMSGEELNYCIEVSYHNIDFDYELWELEEPFSDDDATRLMNYVNAVIEEIREEGDSTDPFHDQELLTLEDAHKLLLR